MGLDIRTCVDGRTRCEESPSYKEYRAIIDGTKPVSKRIIIHLDRPMTEGERRSNLRLLKR